jgi:cardiolipin synthase
MRDGRPRKRRRVEPENLPGLRRLRGLRARLRGRRLRTLDLPGLDLLARVGEAPILYGNAIRLLLDGLQASRIMEEDIASARATICVEMYLWRNDRFGRGVAALLAERARTGIQVRVIYDAYGCLGQEAVFRPILDAGGLVVPYEPLPPIFGRIWPGFPRDHRKLVVVDGRTAFVGSRNFGEEYSEAWAGPRAFRDLTLRIEGPGARECLRLFLHSWMRYGPEEEGEGLVPLLASTPPREAGSAGVQVLGRNRGPRGRRTMRDSLVTLLRLARREVFFAHAYFFPDHRTLGALRAAARRGVRVTVLLPADSDVPVAREAGRSFYGRLLGSGVDVLERQGRMLHMKAGIVDEEIVIAGSANLDTLSLFKNLEVAVNVFDATAARELRGALEEDLHASRRVTRQEWARRGRLRRLLERIAAWLRAWY